MKAILYASLDRGAVAVEKFSRWLRAVCTILMASNRPEDRRKAASYIEQAADVIRDNPEVDNDENDVSLKI